MWGEGQLPAEILMSVTGGGGGCGRHRVKVEPGIGKGGGGCLVFVGVPVSSPALSSEARVGVHGNEPRGKTSGRFAADFWLLLHSVEDVIINVRTAEH